VENIETSDHDREVALGEVRRLLAHLYNLCDMGAPAVHGAECMECGADPRALWIVGDFLLCHRCTWRRRTVGKLLERGAI
jgi:hypothetical protein